MSKSIVTPVGRASFPYLSKLNQYGKYGLTVLFLKTDPKVQTFVQWLGNAVKEEARTIAGDAGYAAAMTQFVSFKDGDNPRLFTTYRNEYAGHWVVSMARQAEFGKPCVVGRNRQPIAPEDVYAGCDVLVYIDVYGYVFGTKKSVTIGFQHVMKVGENVRFSKSGVEVDAAFGDLDLPADTGAPVVESPFGAVQPQGPQIVGAPPTTSSGNAAATRQPVPAPVAAPAGAHDPFAKV